jgi:hypothetical protein
MENCLNYQWRISTQFTTGAWYFLKYVYSYLTLSHISHYVLLGNMETSNKGVRVGRANTLVVSAMFNMSEIGFVLVPWRAAQRQRYADLK